MTKTKKQLRAEAVERLKDAQTDNLDWMLLGDECPNWVNYDTLSYNKAVRERVADLLTDDDANDDSTSEKVVSGSEPCVTPESCRQYADQRKQGDDADCESCDSREQLEADVRDICWGRNIYRFDSQKLYLKEHGLDVRENIVTTNYEGHVLVNVIMHLLDRQAAITQHEITERWAEHLHPIERECGDLRRKVAELTAERDEIAELVGWHGEADGNSGRPLLVPMVAAMCEGSDVAAKLQAKVDELTAERDKLKELNGYHAVQYELASEDCDRLQTQVDELTNAGRKMSTELANMQDYITKVRAGRERYRSMCSEMATKIHDALMVMDEGMA